MTGPHVAGFAELDTTTLYRLLRLRVDVFVVEQACAYPELDGRDLEPGTRHWWFAEGDRVVAGCRLLTESRGGVRLGRVATAPDRRGRGLAGRLVGAALASADRPVLADVQAHLADWYAGHGFEADGPGFDDFGLPHVPMRLR